VNAVDASALESLEAINRRLSASGLCLHISEVKGPVMDALVRSRFLSELTGQVFLSQNAAYNAVIGLADIDEQAQEKPDIWLARGMI